VARRTPLSRFAYLQTHHCREPRGTLDSILGTDSSGLVYLNSLGIAAFAGDPSSSSGKVPYSTNWDVAVQFQPFKNTSIEIAYVGNKGTHLFLPLININDRNTAAITTLESQGIDVTNASVADPLGRRNLQGAVITISRASALSTYLGFDPLNQYFDPRASSIRHAGYIDIRRQVSRGLALTANYTYAKSIDTASDASPDTRVLSTGQARGQVSLGGSLGLDRSISTFDVKNILARRPFGMCHSDADASS